MPEILSALDTQIYQLPSRITPEGTDMLGLDDDSSEHKTWKISLDQLSNFVFSNSLINEFWISNAGSDVTGNGSINNPWETVNHANANLPEEMCVLNFSPGVYSENDFSFKRNVIYDLNGAELSVVNTVTLDAGWNENSGRLVFRNAYNLNFQSGINLDFNSAGSTFSVVEMSDVVASVNFAFNVAGNETGTTIAIIKNIGGFSAQPAISIYNCYGAVINSTLTQLSLYRYSPDAGGYFNIENTEVLTDLYVSNATTVNSNLFITGSNVSGDATFVNSSSGSYDINARGNVFNNVLCVGENVNFLSDTIQKKPILSDGAVFNPVSLANGVKTNYLSEYFSSIDDSVTGAIEGIDNKFQTITYAAKVSATLNYVIPVPCPYFISVNMSSTGQYLRLPNAQTGASGKPLAVGFYINVEVQAGSEIFALQYNDATLFGNINPSDGFYLYLEDNSTPNGTWSINPFVRTVNGFRGQVTLKATDIQSNTSVSNYAPTDTKISGHLLGVNNQFASTYLFQSSNSASVTMTPNIVYKNTFTSGQAVFTAPAAPVDNQIIGVIGVKGASSSGWKVNASGSQKFQVGSAVGTAGSSGGFLASTSSSATDSFFAVYDAASSLWIVYSYVGAGLIVI